MVHDKFISVARAGVILKTDRKSPYCGRYGAANGIDVWVDWQNDGRQVSPPALYLVRESGCDGDGYHDDEFVKVCDFAHDSSITDQPCFSSMRIRESDVHDFLVHFAAGDFTILSLDDIRECV